MSGAEHAGADLPEGAAAVGANHFLAKPFEPSALLHLIGTCVPSRTTP